jgi:pimeloyl-ACP methyl ester carboxylesterase
MHGAGGTHQHWGLQLRGLSDMVRVVAFDLPGHGRSAGPGRNSVEAYSQALLALLDELQLEQAVLAGHSMGGAIALWVALQCPERVAGLVLAGTGARLHIMPAILDGMDQNPVWAIRLIMERAYDQYAILSALSAGENAFLQIDPLTFQADLLACDNFDVRPRLGEITCPALVLCGESDQMTPLKFSQTLHEGIADAELVTVPRAGHMVILEQADVVNAAIREWLTSRYKIG